MQSTNVETCSAGSSCEIQQNASSFFCRVLCFDFCASCIPLNGEKVILCQRRHPPPRPPLSPPLPPSLALMSPPPPPLSSLLAVSSPLAPPPAPPPSTASRVFGRARCPKFPVSLVAQATGGWSEVNWLEKQGWSSISNSTTSSIIGSSSSGGQRYKVVSPLDARQVWFVVRRGNDELSTDFQKEVATLWSIRHTNLQRLLGYCWEKPGSADSTKSTGAEKAIAYSAPAASVHALEQAEEQVLVFEWVPGGNLHSRLVAEGCSPLSVWQCLDVTAGVLRGLKHIQSHGVVHGRILPRNILLDSALQAVLAGCTAVKMGDPLPSIPAPAPPASLSASAAASVTPAVRPPASHAYMDPILHASARTTPTTDVFSIGVVMLQLITGRPALIPIAVGNNRQGNSSGSSGGGSSSNSNNSISTDSHSSNSISTGSHSSNSINTGSHSSNSIGTGSHSSSSMSSGYSASSTSVHIRDWAHHLITRNITASLRATHLPSAPDAIVLPMVRLALSCTASDPLSRPTVTDLLCSIKALKRSLSAHPRPALPANAGTGGDGDTAGAAGGGGAGEQQGGESGDGLSGGFSQNALDAKLDWLMEEEDSGIFLTDV
ncbi:unnamed protein product [Closterium sp. Naga37s-1]|nr:unnamed protein product [Closterium sp. Naga37s-1]